MIRNLKALGLLAFAALAMSATFASAAPAQTNGVLTAGDTVGPEHDPATIVGTQYPEIDGESSEEEVEDWKAWNFFKPTPGSDSIIQCDIATLTATSDDGTETSLKAEADYRHCRANGSQDAIVDMNGCNYLLEQATKLEAGKYTGGASLTCPIVEGSHERIEVDVYLSGNATNTSQFFQLCTVEIYPAEGSEEVGGHTVDPLTGENSHVIYENKENGKDDVTAKVTIEGITVTDGCNGDEHHNNGVYSSTVTIEAFNDEGEPPHEEQLDLWITDEEA